MSKSAKSNGFGGKRTSSEAVSKGSAKKPKSAKDDDDDDIGDSAKKAKNVGYRKFMQRAPPQALGSKEIPQGPEDCLAGLDFVISGVLDSIERDDAEDLIKRHGGAVKSGVSKKTSYLLAGRDAGESKMKKARELKTSVIDEDGLFDLIRNAAKKGSSASSSNKKPVASPAKSVKKPAKITSVIVLSDDDDDQPPVKKTKTPAGAVASKPSSSKSDAAQSSRKEDETPTPPARKVIPASPAKRPPPHPSGSPVKKKAEFLTVPSEPLKAWPTKKPSSSEKPVVPAVKTSVSATESRASSSRNSTKLTATPVIHKAAGVPPALLWVDKYKPKSLDKVVGQHTPASPANKLLNWLKNWYSNRSKNGWKAASAGLFNKSGSGDGSSFKAALLSGPPGIGKTTTAILACQELGFAFVHMNASDSRSKKILDQQFMSGVTSHSLLEYKTAVGGGDEAEKRSVLVMDEVDGMAGNEDRGGIQEVIALIKNTRMPVICICNDRQSQKMRSLAGYCYDLHFQRPRIEQVRAAMLTVCAREGIKIQPNALDVIIESSRRDLRQTLHNLYTWTANKKSMSYDEAKSNASASEKDSIKMGPFDACRNMFSAPKGRRPGDVVNEKMDLYFEDYNFVPLFIFENYLQVQVHGDDNKYQLLDRLSKAADSFSFSDLIDAEVRGKQRWDLLPQHAVFSAVIPGNVMRGHMGGMISFPQWLGKNSSTTKNKRLIQELQGHVNLRVSANFTGLSMDYLPVMRQALVGSLKKGEEGIEKAVEFVNSYDLIREDIDSIVEVTSWGKDDDPMKGVPTAVKSAFTRQLNKGNHLNPYATGDAKKSRGRGGGDAVPADLMDEETAAAMVQPDDEEDDAKDDDVTKDAMIKSVKTKTSKAGGFSRATNKPSTKPAAATGSRGGRSGASNRGGANSKAVASLSRRGKR